MNQKKVMISEVIDFFEFERISGGSESLDRWVIVSDVTRPQFALAGYKEPIEPRRIVLIGDAEQRYIENLDDASQCDRFDFLTDGFTPMIIITHGRNCPMKLKEIADRKNFPIYRTPLPTQRIMVDLVSFLDERLAPEDIISGELVNIKGKGVLILGESGMGKSEIALSLIEKGYQLVADDRVDVIRVHNKIKGFATEELHGFMELRGVGVVDITRMYGVGAVLGKSQIDLIIKLELFDSTKEYQRLGADDFEYMEILDVNIPIITIPVTAGRNMAKLVESAVDDFKLKQGGYNSSTEFKNRIQSLILKQNKN